MRSPHELAFRMRQEIANISSLITATLSSGPKLLEPAWPLSRLPNPDTVRERLIGTPYHINLENLAGEILRHRFPLFDATLDTGAGIDWRRDYCAGISSNLRYFRSIPYLDRSRVGDHKAIWELNRHQHLVVLAQAFRMSGRSHYIREIESEIESWLAANPYLRGINWTSALEIAFRALSWIWVYHLAGAEMKPGVRLRLLRSLYWHARYLDQNLSVYFSPNTHLLGEAVALHAIGALFPQWPGARGWESSAAGLVEEQLEVQVRDDGSHFEQSAYYHMYALDMFLFHYAIARPGASYLCKLKRMGEYLAALMGVCRSLPMLGDDDGGRFFYPYGPRDRFARATLATCGLVCGEPDWISAPEDLHEQASWWLDASGPDRSPAPRAESRLFPGAGVVIMAHSDIQIIFDAGPLGSQGGGHSHSDALSLIVRRGDADLLIDPGSYTYVGDARWRNWFRGSAAHNTIRIDGRDQAFPAGPFRWTDPPQVTLSEWITCPEQDYADALCRYRKTEHRRRVLFLKSGILFVCDQISGANQRVIEQFWHFGEPVIQSGAGCFDISKTARLAIPSGELAELTTGGEHGWRSRAFGQKSPSPVLRVYRICVPPAFFGAALDFAGSGVALELQFETDDRGRVGLTLRRGAEIRGRVWFPPSGMP